MEIICPVAIPLADLAQNLLDVSFTLLSFVGIHAPDIRGILTSLANCF